MREIEETTLPGVGVRHEFLTRGGDRVAVLNHRSGYRELLLYRHDDPDSCRAILRLDDEDSTALAELLGGPHLAPSLTAITQEVEGLVIDWVPIRGNAPCVGRPLSESRVEDRTGVSVVAALRGEEAVPAPGPDFALQQGDTLVVVGTGDGVREAAELLRGE
ncbi:potassium transporter TrkA [Egibacter rhizosphaerae]|uniref:Potassium transporter TrkA n=1 Tax=Egibacter rhizosphaerae TaxID=1670831 RepID=A0A411YIZ6_9ACTN|nr:cation:proton antiporter regulatory subunit [Egibacter rhizosphaerae]QBI21167.1 potassium transporter TrkA [Egibacter rhizosphaerae]